MKPFVALTFALCLTVTLCFASTTFAAAESVKSGLQQGEFVSPFTVQDCTGPAKDDFLCYACKYGKRPVVGIFVKQWNAAATELVKQLDAEVAKHQNRQLRAFVVLLTDDPDADKNQLVKIANENQIEHIPLTLFDGPSGPPAYKISKDADVTVLMWVRSEVMVNHAFVYDQVNEESVKNVINDTTRILKP